MQYGNRSREPSAGVVSRVVHGSGKLTAGLHDLEVLAVPEYPTHRVVLLQNSAGHVHAEPVTEVPAWIRPGTRVRARIGVGPGFVVVRDVDRYQARDAQTKQPLSDWTDDVGQLYRDALSVGAKPATTVLLEVTGDGNTWQPILRTNATVPTRPETDSTPRKGN